jgi:LPS-assembly protein
MQGVTERFLRSTSTYRSTSRRFLILLIFIGIPILAVLLGALPLQAQERQPAVPQELREEPILFSADEVTYDEELGLVTARGDVEINQEGRSLLADTVSYNQRTGVVTASGNVRLIELDGTAYFAEYVELTDDLREGFIRDIGVLMADRTRIAAASGTRRDGRITVFRKAVFSPCELCEEDPTRAPLWQLKADQVIHDQEERTLTYRDAHMEFYGIPVAYTPYFKHPDPTVDRQSGFLAPTFGNTSNLGYTLQVPYFWNIAPNQDFTFEPIITTEQSVVLAGEYRELFPKGLVELGGSATVADREKNNGETKSDQFRGHIDSKGRFAIDDRWRWGFDVEAASDQTYLRLYNFSNKQTLTTNLFSEYLRGRNYFAANGYVFQSQRERTENKELPIITPLLDYNFLSEPDSLGGRYSFDTNLGILSRIDGRDTRRISLKSGWQVPFLGPIGDLYRISASLQTDGYWVDDFNADSPLVNPPGSSDTDVVGRFFPQLAAQWRLPVANETAIGYQVLEPVVQVVAAPDWANNGDIPNEDSRGFEFDDTNLLSLNRFPGVDRVDPGSRVDYGLEWSLSSVYIGEANFFMGQSYRFENDDAFVEGSGLDENLSDVVGRIRLVPQEDIDISYRFRLDDEDLSPKRHELDLRIGPPALNLDLTYLYDDLTSATDLDDREEVRFRLKSRLNENWFIEGAHRRDLENDDPLETAIGLTYQDECFLITLEVKREYFEDREINEEDSIMVKLEFKHLGEVSASQ